MRRFMVPVLLGGLGMGVLSCGCLDAWAQDPERPTRARRASAPQILRNTGPASRFFRKRRRDNEGPRTKGHETSDGDEVIRERYPKGQLKVERHVTQDAAGNFCNHGPWTMWDEQGKVIGRGEYLNGTRHGKWTRTFRQGEGKMFTEATFQRFRAPFVTEGAFDQGQVHGTWTIHDARGLLVIAWDYDHGQQHGVSTWWHPNGQMLREINYQQGAVHGDWNEWGADKKLLTHDTYIQGRRFGRHTEFYAPKQKRNEGTYLFTAKNPLSGYDLWLAAVNTSSVATDETQVRHGLCTWWHPNGQKQMEGNYHEGTPVGKFTWWHSNGQKQLEGQYSHGKQHGEFTWWHANGQKQQQLSYFKGEASGQWMRWAEDGKVQGSGQAGVVSAPAVRDGFAPDAEPIPIEVEAGPDLEAAKPSKPSRLVPYTR